MGHEEVYPAPSFLSPFLSLSLPMPLLLSLSLFFFPFFFPSPPEEWFLAAAVCFANYRYVYVHLRWGPPYLYVYVVLLVHACMRMRVCRCIPVVCPRLVTCLPFGVHHSVLVFASSAAPCEKEKGGRDILLSLQSWGVVYTSCPMCSGCLVLLVPCPAPPTSYLRAKYDRSTLS